MALPVPPYASFVSYTSYIAHHPSPRSSLLVQPIRISLLRSLLQLRRAHIRIGILELLFGRRRRRSESRTWNVRSVFLQRGIKGASEVRSQACQIGWLGFARWVQGFDGLGGSGFGELLRGYFVAGGLEVL